MTPKQVPSIIAREHVNTLLQAATENLEYQDRPSVKRWANERGFICGNHPFIRDADAIWIGRPGISESVGAWMTSVMQTMFGQPEPIVDITLTIYAAPFRGNAPSNPNREFLYGVLFTDSYTTNEEYLCGGGTNCSGEGGSANKLARTFMDALAAYLGVTIKKVEISLDAIDNAQTAHNLAITEHKKITGDYT